MSKIKKILIADDEEEYLDVVKGIIETFGHEVTVAHHGQDALSKLNADFDLILLDIRMPVMNGYETAIQIRKNPRTRDIPIIMVTALGSREDRLEAVKAGANDFIQKPVDAIELKVRMESLLRFKEYQDEIKAQRAQLKKSFEAEKELLEKTLRNTVEVLVDILGQVNPLAFSQTSRIRSLIRQICLKLEIPSKWQYELAAMLSHIGCVTIPSEVLERYYRGEVMTPDEEEMLESHPQIGQDLLQKIPRLEVIAKIVGMQSQIPNTYDEMQPLQSRPPHILGGQLLRTVRDYDVLLSRGIQSPDAIKELMSLSDSIYDPIIISTLQEIKSDRPDNRTNPKSKEIPINQIDPGMILAQDIFTGQGIYLVRKNQIITPSLLKRLKNYFKFHNLDETIQVYIPENQFRESHAVSLRD